MQPIFPTQATLIATVQEKYMAAIAQGTPQEVAFWCGQLAELVAQHKVMKETAEHSVEIGRPATRPARIMSSLASPSSVNLPKEQWDAIKSGRVQEVFVPQPQTPPPPTQYNWDDGFQGVELSDEWER